MKQVKKEKVLVAVVITGMMLFLLEKTITYSPVTDMPVVKVQYTYVYDLPIEVENEEKEEIAPVQQLCVKSEDEELLARLIYAEAGSSKCSYEMKYLVGVVALNRVASPDYPDTLQEVVYQTESTLQYACVEDGNINKQPTEECVQIAHDLLTNGYDVPDNVIFQSESRQGSGVYKHIGNMYFCYR